MAVYRGNVGFSHAEQIKLIGMPLSFTVLKILSKCGGLSWNIGVYLVSKHFHWYVVILYGLKNLQSILWYFISELGCLLADQIVIIVYSV